MDVGTVWFIAWVTGITVLAILIVTVNAAAEYRRLRRRGTPRPVYLLWRRTGARFVPSTGAPQKLEGRLVWVGWDIRRLTSGETMARVLSSGIGNDLVLGLETPIVPEGEGSLPGVRLDIVTFIPSCSGVAPYERCAVPGRLTPPIMPGLEATARIVVYPAHLDPIRPSGGRT
jgi:hypothetical protein